MSETREVAKETKHTPTRCGDEFHPDGQTLLCQKAKGHDGMHESGDWEWYDSDNAEKFSDPCARLRSDRDALLAACKEIEPFLPRFAEGGEAWKVSKRFREAIAAATRP